MSPHKRTRKAISGPSSRSQTSVNITQHSSPGGSPMLMDGTSKTGKKGRHVVRRRKESGTQRGPDHISPRVTIEALPDIVLLDIFEFYGAATFPDPRGPLPWPWNRLVHTCQRWRYLVFASPLRLDLRLCCTYKTPMREMLDVWPPLPIEIIDSRILCDEENIIAALEHRDRICRIRLSHLTSPLLERLVAMMQEPFPALTQLELWSAGVTASALPDMFLGGSAPRLQTLFLWGIPFPGLPRLLLSSSDLSYLTLWMIPRTSYISPEEMVTGLSALTRLAYLTIEFESPASRPDRRGRRPLPLTRVVLPALTNMTFQGDNEYLEDFIARIDAPRLNDFNVCFFNFDQLVFDIPQLLQFITRTGMTKSYNRAGVVFDGAYVEFSHHLPEGTNTLGRLKLGILCRGIGWQVSCMAQICSQYSFLLPSVEQLDICQYYRWKSRWQVDSDVIPWLELFRPFTAVRTLRISCHPQSYIVHALQDLTGERTIEVLPALDGLYLEDYKPSGPEQKALELFIATRQYSDRPVAVHRWERPRLEIIKQK
ncbi:hypothetical protein BJV78DRAFT_1354345 [Lactifluus subvellereus]|nr:hypothetical protein BJV78DRAFT_1354345 [Lactifluus subvellereus]